MSSDGHPLHDLLSVSVVLDRLCPYLPIASLFALSSVCRSIRELLLFCPQAWRYLNLSTVKSAILPYVPVDSGGINWRSQRMDENLTEDEFYSGPIRGIFSNLRSHRILAETQILILDGLSVPADLVSDIISDAQLSVRILSIRGATHLNERKLQQVLQYAVRRTRQEGTPKLKGLYVFGQKEAVEASIPPKARSNAKWATPARPQMGVTESEGATIGATWDAKSQDALTSALGESNDVWYKKSGKVLPKTPGADWADTLQACEGIIAFDAVLCRGPRHEVSLIEKDAQSTEDAVSKWLRPAIATISLGPRGCESCHSCCEGPAVWGHSPTQYLPLLAPPPLHSPSIKEAQRPRMTFKGEFPQLVVRCEACLFERWCERCYKFWDEACYVHPIRGQRLTSEVSLYSPAEKFHLGLCSSCLVGEMMIGAGSNGMWG